MKSLLLLPFLLQEPDVNVLSKPYLTLFSEEKQTLLPLTNDFCDELKYNYLNEKTELQNFISRQNFLKNELKRMYLGHKSELSENEILQQLSELNKGIKVVIEKLKYLADEKFTSEVYQLNVNWSMPVFKRHLEEEYNRVDDLLKQDGIHALSAYDISVHRAGKPNTHRAYDLNYFYYAGEEAKDLHHDFYVNTANNFTGVVRAKDWHSFSIKKKSSKLEICQFIPSLEIGLEITETVKHDVFGTHATTRQLYLKFEENL